MRRKEREKKRRKINFTLLPSITLFFSREKGLCQEARHEYKQAANTYQELLDLAVRSYNNLTSIDPAAKPFVETALCNLPLLQFEYVQIH
jgi:hypothetical protein